MNLSRLLAASLTLTLLMPMASAQNKVDKAPAGETKLQVFFTELETQWFKAAQAKDQKALNGIVGDEFQLWNSASPGKSIPRAEWLGEVFSRNLLSFNVRQLAVRQLSSEIAVVSFIEAEQFQQTAIPQTQEHFIVDVWMNKGSGDNWRCTDRYLSEVRAAPGRK